MDLSPNVRTWGQQSDYFGYNPTGHIVVLTMHRDSGALDRSNYTAAVQRLCQAAGLESLPPLEGSTFETPDPSEAPVVYDWEASHWAVGWVRYLMVRPDAPAAVLAEAEAIADALESYPALDEMAWSELEWEEAAEFWASMSVRSRADFIREANRLGAGISLFAARRDYLPSDDNGALFEMLRD